MQAGCEVYVDPDEDEVFFGRVSEKEKNVCAKLVNREGSGPKNDLEFGTILKDSTVLNGDEAASRNKLLGEGAEQFCCKLSGDVFASEAPDLVKRHEKLKKSFFEGDVSSKIISDNSSVELEHNYSTPMKHKIDKSILATPKSVVKADKDGGFLKVLSEIALVKAEAEGDQSEGAKEDEDKENKSSVPEIRITEATPEKVAVASPAKGRDSERRRFRVVCGSPRKERNVDHDSKLHSETLEGERNLKNKCLNDVAEKFSMNGKEKRIDSVGVKDFAEPGAATESFSPEGETAVRTRSGTSDDENRKKSEVAISKSAVSEGAASLESSEAARGVATGDSSPEVDLRPPRSAPEGGTAPNALRFSKDARKVVEVLKKSSAVDDTLNSTVPEINLEEEENGFLSPEPVSMFDDTVVPGEKLEIRPPESKPGRSSPEVKIEPTDHKAETKSKTVEKDRSGLTPNVARSGPRPIKYFSERRVYGENRREIKNKCTKRLPFEENRPAGVEKMRGGAGEPKTAPSSRIPVFGTKNSKLPIADRNPRPPALKVTPSQSPVIRTQKNPKFNHIESPINAYIHNKPTSLVLNVKPQAKKDSLTKVWKAQATGDPKKVEEKAQKAQKCDGAAGVGLPFVEYESTTPYKIEKRPESRLPRLAPTVMKLIGPRSPRVLKHEGRFYVNSPGKQCPTGNGTIVADPNEVSVLVSRPAQKSNTIK